MAKNELLPFADGEDANVLPTNQWEALTDILENGFQSGIARSEQVNRVLAQGAVASYVLGQLIVDQLNKDATLDKDTLYQNLVSALQENAMDACLPLSGGNVTGNLTVQGKNVVRLVNGSTADANGNVTISVPTGTVSQKHSSTITTKEATKTVTGLTANKPVFISLNYTNNSYSGSTWAKCWVTSGLANNQAYTGGENATVSVTTPKGLATGEVFGVVIPTGTSISIYVNSGYAGKLILKAYQ